MLVLALDTATPMLVVGVARWAAGQDIEVLAERAVTSGNRHAELLTPTVRDVLADAGLAMAGLDAIVTGLGPGPYTGLRVGVVSAAALGDARGLPVLGVCTHDAIGSGARTVVTDARRKEVYWATYSADGSRIEGPDVVRPEELHRTVRRGTAPFVGDPAFAERLGAAVTPAEVSTAGLVRAAAAQLADPSSAAPLIPLYLRRPDATPPASLKAVSTA